MTPGSQLVRRQAKAMSMVGFLVVPVNIWVDQPCCPVLTVQAGVQWQEAYTTAHNAGRMIVGGISPGGSVGAAGGWILGGSHSALSPTYGLGACKRLSLRVLCY